MTLADRLAKGVVLRLYLAASPLLAPLLRCHLARRLARGKEDPLRWREKLGHPSLPRPDGPLIWMHAVGVGEALALPGLARAMLKRRPGMHVLVTSGTRTSAEALAGNLPERTFHQFLPLDAAPFVAGFLDHWRPDLAVWAERDIWPAMVAGLARRGVAQVLVNGRMDCASLRAKARAGRLYRDLYRAMAGVGVQDSTTAVHFAALGVAPLRITVDGSLKAGADPLADLPGLRAEWQARLAGRRVWLAASTHPGDEVEAAQAHALLRRTDPAACLIVAPRDPARAAGVLAVLRASGFRAALTEGAPECGPETGLDAYVVPKIGQMGLWYRLADTALVGGSLATVGGHNPYEPARLDCAILHGPHVGNFAGDYAAFHAASAARLVTTAAELAAALADPALALQCAAAAGVADQGRAGLDLVAQRLLSVLAVRCGSA